MNRIRQLREEYAETWQEFSREFTRLQQLTGAKERDYPGIEAALAAVQAAREKHNEVRDRLASALTGAEITLQVRYARSSVSSIDAPAKTNPSLMTRA